MAGNGFNVFDYVDELKGAGLPDKQADIFARAFHEMASASAATKQDLEVTKMELKRDIENVRSELKRDIAMLKKDMVIYMGGYAIFILGSSVTLAKLGLLSPS